MKLTSLALLTNKYSMGDVLNIKSADFISPRIFSGTNFRSRGLEQLKINSRHEEDRKT